MFSNSCSCNKVRNILRNTTLYLADKLIEMQKYLPKSEDLGMTTVFGQKCGVRKEGNTRIFDGSAGHDYIDNPRLENPEDLYYSGYGCT